MAMVGSSHSANSSKQRTIRSKVASGVVVEREVWCRPEEGVVSRTVVVEPLPVLQACRVPNVAQKQTT